MNSSVLFRALILFICAWNGAPSRTTEPVLQKDESDSCSTHTECLALANLLIDDKKQNSENRIVAIKFYRRASILKPDSKQAWLGCECDRLQPNIHCPKN